MSGFCAVSHGLGFRPRLNYETCNRESSDIKCTTETILEPLSRAWISDSESP